MAVSTPLHVANDRSEVFSSPAVLSFPAVQNGLHSIHALSYKAVSQRRSAVYSSPLCDRVSTIQEQDVHGMRIRKMPTSKILLSRFMTQAYACTGLNTQLSDVKKSRRVVTAELEELKEKIATAEKAPPAVAAAPAAAKDESEPTQPPTPSASAGATSASHI